ncbi:MAG: TolC family protein, partial [Sandaracinaceae bacterium]|nr:TolC family protein [Sandaracinaceae bacterium]
MRTGSLALLVATTLTAIAGAVPARSRAQSMTASEALSLALARHPSLRAAEADLRSSRAQALAAEGARTPSLIFGAQGTFQESFAGTSMGITRNASESVGGNVALRYTTEIGTVLEVGLSSTASWRTVNLTPGTTTTINVGPNYLAQLTVDARQPLLRGLGVDAILAPIEQARESTRSAEHERDRSASQLALDVLSAWWELWYAQSAVAVQQSSLQTAQHQLEAARLRASALGTASRADMLQFASQHASIRESLALAQSTRAARAITLGRLLAIAPERALD